MINKKKFNIKQHSHSFHLNLQQAASRSLSHTGITNSTMQSFTNNNLNTTSNANHNLLNNNNLYNGTTQTSVPANLCQSSNNNNNNNNSLMTQRINAAAAAIVAQQQHNQQKFMLHSALSRAASHPQGNVVSFVNSLIENLGQGHRKLERTQSEPLPQANTSR